MVAAPPVAAAGPLDSTPPAPGTEFAGHVVEELLGRGGMGVVFRARQPKLSRTVAMKVIAPELRGNPTIQRRFLEEGIAAASIEHPNSIPVHDAGEAEGVAYLVMRYVHGMDLHSMVRCLDPLEPARAAEIVAAVGDALDAVHRAGYVHRDVKPRNVLLGPGGHVYLSDFGLARKPPSAADAKRTGRWAGTVNYVAPEQIRGEPEDARSDVYALGGLLHFVLTGRPPYARENDAAKLRAHLYEPPPVPSRLRPDLPRALDAVVARALAKNPADRYASAGELGGAARMAAARTSRRPVKAPGRARAAAPAR